MNNPPFSLAFPLYLKDQGLCLPSLFTIYPLGVFAVEEDGEAVFGLFGEVEQAGEVGVGGKVGVLPMRSAECGVEEEDIFSPRRHGGRGEKKKRLSGGA
jgi:hypothetical protein